MKAKKNHVVFPSLDTVCFRVNVKRYYTASLGQYAFQGVAWSLEGILKCVAL